MSITTEEQNIYNEIINSLYGSALGQTASQINSQVVDDVNTVLQSIVKCSKALAETAPLLGLLTPEVTSAAFIKAVLHIGYEEIKNWLDVVKKHEEYQACVTVATADWEDAIEIALLGVG
ncbi:hypothetical protein [Acidithiobacillus sp.]|jgi:hypothetical protein|uniref:hypothetical protein n=1 Tax=Acidithiobacillus sp. TaxID=1872118 RepID=UPI003CFD6EF7